MKPGNRIVWVLAITAACSLASCREKKEREAQVESAQGQVQMKSNAQLQMKSLVQALELYRVQTGAYPTAAQGLQALVEQRIIERLPSDPWGHPFIYAPKGAAGFTLTSLGADGKPGGTGVNTDLTIEP